MRIPSFSPDGYGLYQFEEPDWLALKMIRLEALGQDPTAFGRSLHQEAQLSDQDWQARLTAKHKAFFGLFLTDGTCIGLTAILGETPTDQSATLVASYIRQAHRGRGLSKLFYQVRIEWARQQGYASVRVSHRSANLASQAANQGAGFLFTHSEERVWSDGVVASELFYALAL